MEVLIHPRVLPLSDFLPVRLSSPEPQATYKFQEDMYFGSMTSSKLLKIDTQGMEQSDPELDDEFSYDRVFANNIEEAPIRDATGNPINDYEMTYNISNDLEKDPYANGLVSIETPKTTEQAATAAITEVGVVEKVDVFASPMSSKSDKTDDFLHDLGSKLLQEDDFPDIIDADPDTDYEG